MKIYFDKSIIGKNLPNLYHIDQRFKIFRYVEIQKRGKEPEAWFIVRFQLKNMTVSKNRFFSIFPMLLLFFFKGFRSKYWLMDEKTNTCMGVYRWQTIEDAEYYSKSIAMKFMTKRSNKGSIHYCIGKGVQPRCEF